MTEIKPNDYLEWEYPRVEPISAPGLYIHDDGDGLEIVTKHGEPDFEKYKIDSWDQDGIAAVMALANHCLSSDDPRKITHLDVEAIEVAAEFYEKNRISLSMVSDLKAAAAKLAALLPPESETK